MKTTQLDLGMRHVEAFVTWMEYYLKIGFPAARTAANSLCEDLEIPKGLNDSRQRRKPRVLDQESIADSLRTFGRGYFLVIFDGVKRVTLKPFPTLTKQLQTNPRHGTALSSCITPRRAKTACSGNIASSGSSKIGGALFLIWFLYNIPGLQELERNYIIEKRKNVNTLNARRSHPNTAIVLRILLTVPLSVASAERSFSKLKPIENFFR
ncbi:unnamed protein product [Ixodes hexagonus]